MKTHNIDIMTHYQNAKLINKKKRETSKNMSHTCMFQLENRMFSKMGSILSIIPSVDGPIQKRIEAASRTLSHFKQV
jgi:hypothetical protein